jgi:hypothetical protein
LVSGRWTAAAAAAARSRNPTIGVRIAGDDTSGGAGGPATEIRRRFVEIWRKEDGAWRVARTLDNAGPD